MNLKTVSWLLFLEVAHYLHGNAELSEKGPNDEDLDCRPPSGILSRKRRYVAFPEGSSFSVAVCSTIGLIGNPNYNLFSYGLNWGVAYDLPNQTWILDYLNGFKDAKKTPLEQIKRRHRRTVYQNVETLINNAGFNGRSCILGALCEGPKYFSKNENDMIHQILKTIFNFPLSHLRNSEQDLMKHYHTAAQRGQENDNCQDYLEDCGFSLIELIFGKYS